ncbi:MAG: hypothetical protein J0I81_05085, partial [Hyphomicrobium sp.]|nr:hypothetical protein [Hyphomicrobium sp.]
MSVNFQHFEPWERGAEEKLERYQRGLALVARHGELNFDDQFAVDGLLEWLSVEDLQDYLFALDHKASLSVPKAAKPAPSSAGSTNPSHCLPPVAPSEPAPEIAPAARPQPNSAPGDSFDELIDKAIERFIDSKKQSTTAATADKYGAQCKLFLKIVTDGRPSLKISDLTSKDVRAYVDVLPRLPTRIDSTDARSLEEILKSSGPTLSAKTVFSHAQATNMFLAWCEAQQNPLRFNFHSILKPLLKKPRIKAKKKAFTPDQLKTLFETEAYSTGNFKRASDYWVPLLGLFTGAREAELCQLEAMDVRQDATTGLRLIDINSD